MHRKSIMFFLKTVLISITCVLACLMWCPDVSSSEADCDYPIPARAGFKITARGITTDLRLTSVFVLPGESLYVACASCTEEQTIILHAAKGETSEQQSEWRWIAPTRPDVYELTVSENSLADTIILRAFVMHPFSRVAYGRLNGYQIGSYPKKPYRGLPQYKPPRGFVEVTEENAHLKVTPHFRLGQFVCKQGEGFPKYVVLRELLLLKLELILEKVNQAGYACSTFSILSGYRTPWYNKSIGNVKYSRHLWGGAADIFIDENPADSMMDDLNRDGRSNWKDAAIIYEIIDNMYGTKSYERFVGGLARYRKTPAHGPFVHVDVRGFRARWGD